MFVPLWLIALVALVLLLLAWLAFRRGSGDMIERQRRDARSRSMQPSPHRVAPPTPDEAALFALPQIREALERGNKIEAIRLVREHSHLGLKESKELVERYQAR